MIPGGVGVSQDGQRVIDSSELRCWANLLLRCLVGPFDNGLPNVLGEGLVGVCRGGQLAAYPGFFYLPVSGYSVIYVPGSIA